MNLSEFQSVINDSPPPVSVIMTHCVRDSICDSPLNFVKSWKKYMRQILVFMWNSALPEDLNFYFSGVFCYYKNNFEFIILWGFEIFMIFPSFLRSWFFFLCGHSSPGGEDAVGILSLFFLVWALCPPPPSAKVFFYFLVWAPWPPHRRKSQVVRQLTRQLVYTVFVTNNHASFHLWWKENLIKYQKVLKYHVHDCRSKMIFIYVISANLVDTNCN